MASCHGGHRQPGAVHHAADVAVELDVVEVELRGLDLRRVLFTGAAAGRSDEVLQKVLKTIWGLGLEVK